jgi:hypothetical protein
MEKNLEPQKEGFQDLEALGQIKSVPVVEKVEEFKPDNEGSIVQKIELLAHEHGDEIANEILTTFLIEIFGEEWTKFFVDNNLVNETDFYNIFKIANDHSKTVEDRLSMFNSFKHSSPDEICVVILAKILKTPVTNTYTLLNTLKNIYNDADNEETIKALSSQGILFMNYDLLGITTIEYNLAIFKFYRLIFKSLIETTSNPNKILVIDHNLKLTFDEKKVEVLNIEAVDKDNGIVTIKNDTTDNYKVSLKYLINKFLQENYKDKEIKF